MINHKKIAIWVLTVAMLTYTSAFSQTDNLEITKKNACNDAKILFTQLSEIPLSRLDSLYIDNEAYSREVRQEIARTSASLRSLKSISNQSENERKRNLQKRANCLASYAIAFSAFRSYVKGGNRDLFKQALASAKNNNPYISNELYQRVLFTSGITSLKSIPSNNSQVVDLPTIIDKEVPGNNLDKNQSYYNSVLNSQQQQSNEMRYLDSYPQSSRLTNTSQIYESIGSYSPQIHAEPASSTQKHATQPSYYESVGSYQFERYSTPAYSNNSLLPGEYNYRRLYDACKYFQHDLHVYHDSISGGLLYEYDNIRFHLNYTGGNINRYLVLREGTDGELQIEHSGKPYKAGHEIWYVSAKPVLLDNLYYDTYCVTPGGEEKRIHYFPTRS